MEILDIKNVKEFFEMMTTSVMTAVDFVAEAERVLADASPGNFAAVRQNYIDEARMRFGTEAVREIDDALQSQHASHSAD